MKPRVPALVSLILVLLAVVLPAQARAAPKRIAVLEFTNKAGLSSFEVETLADDVRGAALVLPSGGFTVMTRESMMAMLPLGTDLSKCSEAECEVDAGRKVGADLVVAGTVGRFSGKLLVRLKLFDTASAALLGQRSTNGIDLEAVRGSAKSEAKSLFRILRGRRGSLLVPPGAGGAIGEQAEDWDFETETGAVLHFKSSPSGAMVEMDGEVLCETPCSKSIVKGLHEVEIKKLRYKTWRDDLDVSENRNVSARLAPNFGWLTVHSAPAGLAVTLNGEVVGTTPLLAVEIDPGAYEVLVTDLRYHDAGERVNLAAGEKKTISVTLKPKQGGLKVAAVDRRGNALVAEVSVDGEQVGETPWAGKVMVGERRVGVGVGEALWEQTVTVRLRQVESLAAVLDLSARPRVVRSGGNERSLGEALVQASEAHATGDGEQARLFHLGLSMANGTVFAGGSSKRSAVSGALSTWLKWGWFRLEPATVAVALDGANAVLIGTGAAWDVVAGLYFRTLFNVAITDGASYWGFLTGAGYGFALGSAWHIDAEVDGSFWPGEVLAVPLEARVGVRYGF
jgi:hypothetical protein